MKNKQHTNIRALTEGAVLVALAFVLSFIPPGQIQTGSPAVWYSVLIAGCIVMILIPLIIYAARKPSWKDPSSEFAPFHWEKGKQNE